MPRRGYTSLDLPPLVRATNTSSSRPTILAANFKPCENAEPQPTTSHLTGPVVARVSGGSRHGGPRRGLKGGGSTTCSSTSTSSASLECPICLDVMTHPITTRCQHSFCFHCLFLSTIRDCPVCRRGPLSVEAGDFEPDALLALRVKVHRSTIHRPLSSHPVNGSSSSGGLCTSSHSQKMATKKGEQQRDDPHHRHGRAQMLRDPAALLADYEARMQQWHTDHSDPPARGGRAEGDDGTGTNTSTIHQVSSSQQQSQQQQHAEAALRVRAALGQALLRHYVYDETAQEQMFHDGGFMRRRAPSLAIANVPPPPTTAEGDASPSPRGSYARGITARGLVVSDVNYRLLPAAVANEARRRAHLAKNNNTISNAVGRRATVPMDGSASPLRTARSSGGGGGSGHMAYLLALESVRQSGEALTAPERERLLASTATPRGGGTNAQYHPRPSSSMSTPRGRTGVRALSREHVGGGGGGPQQPLLVTPRGKMWTSAPTTHTLENDPHTTTSHHTRGDGHHDILSLSRAPNGRARPDSAAHAIAQDTAFAADARRVIKMMGIVQGSSGGALPPRQRAGVDMRLPRPRPAH